jgi:hypothetical protein
MSRYVDPAAQAPPGVRRSPLLSEEGKRFLAGELTAADYLETARRRAIEQTRREIAPHLRRATQSSRITAMATFALFWIGAAFSLLVDNAPGVLVAVGVGLGTLSAGLGLLAHTRLQRGR